MTPAGAAQTKNSKNVMERKIDNMDTNWVISENQKKLLDSLFDKIEGDVKSVLDLGSGRTSIQYLTERYRDLNIEGVVYPGDARKTDPIKECVSNTNYAILESDIADLDFDKSYDVVLAHLFLGEAEKFAGNKFHEILDRLFELKTRYLVVVNLSRDNIDYNLLLRKIAETGEIKKVSHVKSESGEDDCIGLLISKTQ